MSALHGMELAWPYGGREVYVVGSWSGWRERVRLGADGRVRVQLPRGFHAYKFVVDGRWCYDVLKPRATDDCGNVNNVLCVPRGEAAVATLPLVCGRARAELWAAQREACARALAKRRPAVVCTQRGLRDQLAYLCQRAGPYRRTGLPENGCTSDCPSSTNNSDGCCGTSNGESEYCAVLWDAEQLLHVASGDFWLSAQPHVPGTRLVGAPAARMATWALLRPYYSGEPALLVCSTALEPGAGAAAAELRMRQAAVLAAQLDRVVAAVRSGDIRDPGTQAPVALAAVVVAGQFGEPAGAGGSGGVYAFLAREGYCDCVREARADVGALRCAPEDWLLVRKCMDGTAPAGTPAPVSWTPAVRTDVAELVVAVDKTGAAPGCQPGHLPLCATLVVTELPRPVPPRHLPV